MVHWEDFDAVLFDLDGVLTSTEKLHATCWKKMFDEYLLRRSYREKVPFEPFDIATDYRQTVDGKPRYEGVRSFLLSRQIELSEGNLEDPPEMETVCGLGNRKDQLLREMLASGGVEVYEGSVTLLRRLRQAGIKTAVVSSSKNCRSVVEAARIQELFDTRVDGVTAYDLGLKGKPDPDTFLEAARRLDVRPEKAVVIEDALAGVQAGRRGGFALVIGVARHGETHLLRESGADIVVEDLAELIP